MLFAQTPRTAPQTIPHVTYIYDAGRIQLEYFGCPSKNGECKENETIKSGYLFTFLKGE